jgi:hypothetical protein
MDEIEAFRRGSLPPDDGASIGSHLRECSECSARATAVYTAAAALFDDLSDLEHPELDELFAYVRGVVTGERASEIGEHVAVCVQCREDLADAARERFQSRRRTVWLPVAAAAAAILIVGSLLWLTKREVPPQNPVTHPVIHIAPSPQPAKPPGEWDTIVDEARHARSVAMPDVVRVLRVGMDAFRGEEHGAARLDLQPSGTVVESQTPTLRWKPGAGERFIVTVVCDDVPAGKSGLIEGGHWTVSKPLPRGATCAWQMERASDHAILPQPPAPQPIFRVLDARQAAEIARAKEKSDDLVVGLLYARAGVQRDALEHLHAWLQLHPNDDAADAILRSIERW